MLLAVCALISWFIIIILSLIPKKLSELDMVLLYFVNAIFEVSIFTLLHVNLNWIDVNHSVEKSLADLVIRFVMNPLLFLIMSNVMMYPWKIISKWVIAAGVALFFILMNMLLERLGINKMSHWNTLYTIGMFGVYAVFSQVMTRAIIRVTRRREEL